MSLLTRVTGLCLTFAAAGVSVLNLAVDHRYVFSSRRPSEQLNETFASVLPSEEDRRRLLTSYR